MELSSRAWWCRRNVIVIRFTSTREKASSGSDCAGRTVEPVRVGRIADGPRPTVPRGGATSTGTAAWNGKLRQIRRQRRPAGHTAFFSGHTPVGSGTFGAAGLSAGAVCADVAGTLGGRPSDDRLNREVCDLTTDLDVLGALSCLCGVTFRWDTSVERAKNMGEQRERGMVAQQVEQVLPEVVGTGKDGYRTLDYGRCTTFLIEVNKAQQAEPDELRARVRLLRIRFSGPPEDKNVERRGPKTDAAPIGGWACRWRSRSGLPNYLRRWLCHAARNVSRPW